MSSDRFSAFAVTVAGRAVNSTMRGSASARTARAPPPAAIEPQSNPSTMIGTATMQPIPIRRTIPPTSSEGRLKSSPQPTRHLHDAAPRHSTASSVGADAAHGLIAQPDQRCRRTYCRPLRRSACSDGMRPALQPSAIIEQLVGELERGRVHSVAFVLASEVTWALPLYEVAIGTARCGWSIAIPDALYWFVTPEPAPLARYGTAVSAAVRQRLEPEGITFIGSTYPEIRHGVVLLDPRGGCIKPDLSVTLHGGGGFDVQPASKSGRWSHPGAVRPCGP
jgi:hypothetical protein